jgi:transcriptional regulator with XRE-family HTH domain
MADKLQSNSPPSHASPSSIAERLSLNIARQRHTLGLTQAQLAERLGVDTETLSRFERGKNLPSLTTLERLSELLMTTVGDLLSESPAQADDDALALTSWLSQLDKEDRVFVRGVVRQCCDYLERKNIRS